MTWDGSSPVLPVEQVRAIQKLLNAVGAKLPTPLSGLMDEDTKRAVRIFQVTHCDVAGNPLDVDGVVGPMTRAALEAAARGRPTKPPVLPLTGGTHGQRIARIALGEYRRKVVESGTNTGDRIQEYQAATKLSGTGWKYCAAFVTWCYEQAGLLLRDEGGFAAVNGDLLPWARDNDGKQVSYGRGRCTLTWHVRKDEPAYRPPPGAIAIHTYSHTGIVIAPRDSVVFTVEANTSPGKHGSQRDGQGVYLKDRSKSSLRGYLVLDIILR